MQTFLPYPDLAASVACLDSRRLGKQRVEAYQILRALAALRRGERHGWQRHPAVRMWQGHEAMLGAYMDAAIHEWERRGYRNNMARHASDPADLAAPPWWGDERLHASHRSNLLRKDPGHYGRFGWREPPDLPYFWPR